MNDHGYALEQALHRVGFMAQSSLVDLNHAVIVDADGVRDVMLDILLVVRGVLDE